ncbi:energy transducer TonB, partial [Lysobacter enzymogenes]|uniref:energy transducer TonB n=1 Tax=Lysobacter enzymogenes TaxID=69 RepID=UPI0019CF744C
PAAALRRGEGGTVVLRVNVGADGRADEVAVARRSGSRELDRAAMVAVRDWRFKPATRNGREVASVVEQPVEFRPMQ